MTRLSRAVRRVAVAGLVAGLVAVATPAVAGASQYEYFGNGWNGDCAFASLANLVRYNWPTAPITTDQVLAAWNAEPQDPLGYMITTGFGGHRISNYGEHKTLSKSLVKYALAHGGLVAWIDFPPEGPHAVAVVGMNASGILSVLNLGLFFTHQDPRVPHLIRWSYLRHALEVAFTVTWAPSDSTAVVLRGLNTDTTPFASLVVPAGSPVTLPMQAPPLPTPQFTFCGWSPNPNDPITVYTPGSTITPASSEPLGAVFFPTAQGCTAWAQSQQ